MDGLSLTEQLSLAIDPFPWMPLSITRIVNLKVSDNYVQKKNVQLDLLYLSVSAHNACRMPHVLILAQVLLHSIFLHSFYSFKITHVNRFMQYYCNNFLLVRYCKGFEFSPNMLQIQSDNRYTSHTANNNRAG